MALTIVQPGVGGTGSSTASSTGTGAAVLATQPSFPSTIGVGGATAAASGAGITFPATQSASSDANTLDDYEEGTWTPAYSASSGSATYASSTAGTYQKIGNRVYCFGVIQLTSTSLSGQIFVTGLPFTTSATATLARTPVCIGRHDSWNSSPIGGAIVGSSVTQFEVYKFGTNNNTTDSVGADTTSSSGLYFSLSYITA
jgi:hypothetical protein